MRRIWKKIASYFLVTVVFISAILLSISFAITNNIKATKSDDPNGNNITWPDNTNQEYPLKKEANIYYRSARLAPYITKKDLFKQILNINHFYNDKIALINKEKLKTGLSELIKSAIDKDPYFQKKTKKLQKLNVSYKIGDPFKISCLFTFGEIYKTKNVYYYDQFSIDASLIK